MVIKDNPYLDQLARDCDNFFDNYEDWVATDDVGMIEKAMSDIEADIAQADSYEVK